MQAQPLTEDPRLAEVVRRLIAAYQPERIHLFGSIARGDATPESDYDFLVVGRDDAQRERLQSRLAWQAPLCYWLRERFFELLAGRTLGDVPGVGEHFLAEASA